MRRFFLTGQACIHNGQLIVAGAEARHISLVLRLQAGEVVEFFDAAGEIWTARLEQTQKERVVASILFSRKETIDSGSTLCLAQCLLKGKKMDLLVQKATELGVKYFLPLRSRYCENHGQHERQEERWQRIMIEACKQCGRTTFMRIASVTAIAEADFTGFRHRLVAWEEEKEAGLPDALASEPGPICLLLGPEGGLAPEDMIVLARQHFQTFSLGPLILRAETAALASISLVRYLSGGLQPPSKNA